MSEQKSVKKDLNKFKGCLVGGAVGDALGYTIEFYSIDKIKMVYGERGITNYRLVDGKALISDDTQMTLFTANGLLLGATRGKLRGIMGSYPHYCWVAYKGWLETQGNFVYEPKPFKIYEAWLKNVKGLNVRRAPGNTCISALKNSEDGGTIEKPINDSKGCGGVMRVAPVGLYLSGTHCSQDKTDIVGAQVAALTHGHELGYIPAAALVHIISLVSDDSLNISLEEAVNDSIDAVKRLFKNAKHLNEFVAIMQKAIELSHKDIDDLQAIEMLGEGWVAEETLAIAVYCALKHQDSFEDAIIAAVNHSGDSDSTGSVTGNILGAYFGYDKIPEKFLTNLELRELIEELATDLYEDCKMSEYSSYRDPVWISKYIDNDYGKDKEW
jgi:ADP-ribosylglycohydrolase